MKLIHPPYLRRPFQALLLVACCLLKASAQAQENPPGPERGPGPEGPPPIGRGGPGGGFGGMGEQEIKILTQFDKDHDHRLNAAERKAAREFLATQTGPGRGQRRFGPPGGRGGQPGTPGAKLTPAEVKSYPNAPLYDPAIVRTFFLEFEEADWEKELTDFHNTDVEVPAKLTVDGRTYSDVGVHFRGMSSYMAVSAGSKRSLNLSLDFAHPEQNVGGYRTLNLLNSHEDPSYLRSVLSYQIDREFLPAPKANFARVVINGESWGIYVNVQQFNKDFVKDWFGTTKGARWKVRGNPGGQGSLAYLGENIASYKKIYTIKSKDDPKHWADLIKLCKVLNETPPDRLESALGPLLDIDGALKFLALDNALINNDGYWIRTSDYAIYQDEKGRFHLIPQDSNETFAKPGGPGFGGPGFGGPGGRGGGPGGFGPGMMLAPQILTQADQDNDQKLTKDEFTTLAERWFDKLDPAKAGRLSQEEFTEHFGDLLPAPGGFAPPGGGRGFGPGRFAAPGFFAAADSDKDGTLTRAEFKGAFGKWFTDWDADKSGSINEEKLGKGLAAVLPPQNFVVQRGGGGRGGPGREGGPGRGPNRGGGGPQIKGVELDPLLGANDSSKPLISKLLAVPALRTRYLGYVRNIAETWLDWQKLGPIAERYQTLIAEDIKADTRKLDSTEDFSTSLNEDNGPTANLGPFGGAGTIGLKSFAEQRRKYLLESPALKNPKL